MSTAAPVAPPEEQQPPVLVHDLVAVLVVLGLGYALTTTPVAPVRTALAFVLLATPVAVLVRRGDHEESVPHRVVLGIGLVLLTLMAAGLALNTALPALGNSAPLEPRVLASALTTGDVLLLVAWRPTRPLLHRGELRAKVSGLVRARFEPATTLASVALILTVAGAVRLNNGAGNVVAVSARAAVVLALAWCLFGARGTLRRDAWVVWLTSASLLLATSLRSWFVVGHDIQREYLVYTLTQSQDHWAMSSYADAYNACMSVTLLPTMLVNLTGLTGPVVFKVLLQLAFAFVPVAVLLIARAFVGDRGPLMAATVVVAFPTFFTDMPYMVRQEIAFLFVTLLCLVAVSRNDRPWRRRTLVVALGAGVVLSHYSTTYLLLISLAAAAVGKGAAALLRRRRRTRSRPSAPRPDLAPSVAVYVPTIAVLAVLTWLWGGPATHSGGHLADTIHETVTSLVSGQSGPASSDVGYGLFSGQQATPQQRLDLYARHEVLPRRIESQTGWLIDDLANFTLPRALETASTPPTALGEHLSDAGIDLRQANSLLRLGTAGLLQLWLLLGVLRLVLARRRADYPTAESRWLVTGSIAGVAVVVLVPGLSAEYGVLRAFQQSLLVAAPAVVVGAGWMFGWLRGWTRPVLVVAFLGVTAVLTGLVSGVTGGYPGSLALASSGQYHDLYYLTDAEVDGMRWLDDAVRRQPFPTAVSVDDAAAGRMTRYTGGKVAISSDFYPLLLQKGDWVFFDAQTVQKEQASVFYTGNLITYRYPVGEVRDRLDIVYSSPAAEVLR